MRLIRLALLAAFGRRLPLTAGELRLPGLKGVVRIGRDRYGVPHIEAAAQEDAWFALGFCQAQDRAFQLELRLRTARGTLSEAFGPATLAIDRLSRRIGFIESARRQLHVLDGDVRGQLRSFVQGINAGLRAGLPKRPHEFLLLQAQPSEWREEDVLGIGKLFAFLLIGNWDVELARLKVLREDGPQALRDLDPSYTPSQPSIDPKAALTGEAPDRVTDDLATFLQFAGQAGGSNSWAVAGARTRSGRPLLANDPHLEPALPPHWYLAHLEAPGLRVAGAVLAGTPAFGIGHNGFAAWGITASLADTADFFLEEVGPDRRSVRYGDAFERCEIRREVIQVRGAAPVIEEVLSTQRGPIVGPALDHEVGAVSLRAAWLDARPARGFLRLPFARSLSQFRQELSIWPLLVQNVTYADADGHVAWQVAGEVPLRRKGWGTLPLPGWDPEAGWLDERVPFTKMPFAADPEQGFIVTANNKPAADTDVYLGVDWLDGYRAARIASELQRREDWDVKATLRLQMDEATLAWSEVRDVVLSLEAADTNSRLGLSLLREWDGRMAVDSSAATVFHLFVAEMWRRVARSRAPRSAEFALGRGFHSLLPGTTFAAGRVSSLLRRLREQPEGWFERGWRAEMVDALASAVQQLHSRFGDDIARWAWGQVRPLRLRHPLGQVKALSPLFERGPFPWGGDGNTVSQASASPLQPFANPGVIASLRFVVEAGDWDNARFVLPGGQSGNPLSPHYDDQLPLWLRGEAIRLAFSPDAVRRAVVQTLTLQPL